MTTKVNGIVLHYYDKVANSNKFYRAFYHSLDFGYRVVYVWGREGANGQKKIETYTNEQYAQRRMEDKCREKEAKGYQRLGEGDVWVEESMINELSYISDRLYALHGHAPDKTRGSGFAYLIIEQPTPEDMIAELMK